MRLRKAFLVSLSSSFLTAVRRDPIATSRVEQILPRECFLTAVRRDPIATLHSDRKLEAGLPHRSTERSDCDMIVLLENGCECFLTAVRRDPIATRRRAVCQSIRNLPHRSTERSDCDLSRTRRKPEQKLPPRSTERSDCDTIRGRQGLGDSSSPQYGEIRLRPLRAALASGAVQLPHRSTERSDCD